MSLQARRWLDPARLAPLGRLDLKARLIVEGRLAGRHRSPFHGFSVEFAEHREYTPGDDLRHLNWKVYARSDRFYVKRYEEETSLRALLLVDASESMAYGSGAHPKFECAGRLAAALAWLLLRQQDAVGLGLFDDELRAFLPPAAHPGQLALLLEALERQGAAQGARSDPGKVLEALAGRLGRRGMVIVISDLLAEARAVLAGLHRLRHRRHEVLVFHLLDPAELEFPFGDLTLFEGLEGAGSLQVDAALLREGYLRQVASWLEEVRRGCLERQVDYHLARTDQPAEEILGEFLAARQRR